MPLFRSDDRRQVEAVSRLAYCNPFLPERIELEQLVLGTDFHEEPAVWSRRANFEGDRANVLLLGQHVARLAAKFRDRLARGADASEADLLLYEDLVLYLLYDRCRDRLHEVINKALSQETPEIPIPFWDEFLTDFRHFLAIPERTFPTRHDPAHLLACFFQVRRAFHHTFYYIVGGSMPAARLRAAVWQSVFTHDMRRYRRGLYDRMGDITTLVTGPSGTGKELVARAVGLSRYIPLDVKRRRFPTGLESSFHAVNLSALSPTLIESELFGHRRGSFTGAVSDREGWLEVCGPLGTVFLDELGDLDTAFQV